VWALTTRVDASRDVLIVDNTPIDYLIREPRSRARIEDGIDATNK